MEYVYGALLLHAAGKEIDEEKLKQVLVQAGVTPDEARLKSLVSSLKEVNIDEVIKNAASAPVAVAAAPSKSEAPAKKEEKKEEKPEANDEDAMAGLSSLFG